MVERIASRQWKEITGADIHFVTKEEIYEDRGRLEERVAKEKNRVYAVLDTLRKSIGGYYYAKRNKTIKDLLKEAGDKRDQERYLEAIQSYDRVLEVYPDSTEALCFKGLCYSRVDDFERALLCYEKVL